MVQVWGLDLNEIHWKKFKSSYMWNNTYHLRRTKFIVYQCAMIFCVVSESLGTAALSNYIDQQSYVTKMDERAIINNNDFVGAFSYNIFVGVYVATIFGSGFFFDLFWPERRESRAVKLAWRICSLLTIPFTLSAALLITIILATHSASIKGVDANEARLLLQRSKPNEPLVYKHNKRGIASVVFIWPGFVATVASTLLLWRSLAHIDEHGPFSTHARQDPEKFATRPTSTSGDPPAAVPTDAATDAAEPMQSVPYESTETALPAMPDKAHANAAPHAQT